MKKLLKLILNTFLFIFIYNTKNYIIKSILYTDLYYNEYKVYCIYRILGIKLYIYKSKFNYLNLAYDYIYERNGIIYTIKYEYK